MAGIKSLRKLQLGREQTAGTAVAATTIWRGQGVLEDQREQVFVEEDIGYLSGVDRAYQPKLQAALSMPSIEATFEQLPHIFDAAIALATPAADSTGSGDVYTYTFPTTAAPTLKTYTIEGGDNEAVEEIEYAFVQSFTLEGSAGEALMVSAEWVGRQVSTSAFTTTATLPTVEDILFSKGKLYIDAADGTIGTTQKSATLLRATLNANPGNVPVYTADGALYFTFVKTVGSEIMLDITFEHDATSVAEIAAFRAGTPRLIRLQWEGSTLTTAGAYTKKTLRVDLAGKWDNFQPLGDQDGNDIVTGTFRARYNATAAKYAQIIVVADDMAALP